ncbi:hypothetical protein CRYUN_Cryun13aG0089600 [Craigia yunnanensis]
MGFDFRLVGKRRVMLMHLIMILLQLGGQKTSAMAALWFKTFLLVFLVLIMPSSYGMVNGLQGGMQAKHSLEQGGMIRMSSSRKLLMLGAMLDYDDTGANHKHDPIKKPGKP